MAVMQEHQTLAHKHLSAVERDALRRDRAAHGGRQRLAVIIAVLAVAAVAFFVINVVGSSEEARPTSTGGDVEGDQSGDLETGQTGQTSQTGDLEPGENGQPGSIGG